MCAMLLTQPPDPRDDYSGAERFHPDKVDKVRLLRMTVTHDLCEALAGDITPYCNADLVASKHQKEDQAMQAIRKVVGDPLGSELYELWKEREVMLKERVLQTARQVLMLLQNCMLSMSDNRQMMQQTRPKTLQNVKRAHTRFVHGCFFVTAFMCEESWEQALLPQYKAVERYQRYAQEEVEMLQTVANAGNRPQELPELFGLFVHSGLKCQHACVAMEVMGPSAWSVAERCRGNRLPWPILVAAFRDTLTGLDYLHRTCSDIKPENILFTFTKGSRMDCLMQSFRSQPLRRCGRMQLIDLALEEGSDATFGLVDLGNSCYTDRHIALNITTLEYKPVEVIMNAGYDTAADIWSLGCTIYELATGRYLFDPRHAQARPKALQARDCFPQEPEHLAQIVELLGPLPYSLLVRSRRLRAFLSPPNDLDQDGGMFAARRLYRLCSHFAWRIGHVFDRDVAVH
eukprot:g20742.t1